MAICPNCNRQLPDGTKFCKYCGTPLSQAEPQINSQPDTSYGMNQRGQYAGTNTQDPVSRSKNEPAHNDAPKPDAAEKNKKKNIIFISIISALVIAAIVCGFIFIPKIFIKDKLPDRNENTSGGTSIQTEQDGLHTIVSTDSDSYKKGDEITLTISVINNTGSDIINMDLDLITPDGIKLKRGCVASKNLSLKNKETKTINLVAIAESDAKNSEVDKSDATKGYDILHKIGIILFIAMILGIAVCVVFVWRHPRRLIKIISAGLSVVIAGGMVPVGMMSFNDNDIVYYVDKEVSVDGKEFVFHTRVSKLSKKHMQHVGVNLGNNLYDTVEDIVYVFDDVTTLKGQLINTKYATQVNCTVKDQNGKELLNKNFSPAEEWELKDFGLVVGINDVKFTVTHRDGYQHVENFRINNLCEENMKTISVDRNDSDNDGVLNFTEELYGTDINNADTDADGLSDYYEMAALGTDPKKQDTDGDQISDADEDSDNDKLTNIEEVSEKGTNPALADTDADSIDDYKEIYETKTNPNAADTDNDGKSDSWEIEKGFNPNEKNESFPKSEGVSNVETITVEADGKAEVTPIENNINFGSDAPGYIGVNPFFLELEKECEATLYIKYDGSSFADGQYPICYKFDEATQDYIAVPTEPAGNGLAKVTAKESGSYVLLNHRFLEDVWSTDIFRPSETTEGAIDIVFVLDRSLSMDQNDPKGLRKEVTKNFINKLRPGIDKAAVVQFTNVGELIYKLSDDKNALIAAVDGIQNSDGGGCAGSDTTAGTNGSAGLRAALNALNGSQAKYKYIIFLTDGKDTAVAEDYGDAEGTTGITGEAKKKGIIIHTVGLIGSGEVDVDLLKRVAKGTGGNYYVATVAEENEVNSELIEIYEDIEAITVDRQNDSNHDGISDYYTKMICEGRITTSTGLVNLFGGASYDDVQKNADLDGDGLLNGDEMKVVENGKGVYVHLNSYTFKKDSDEDGISDPEENKNSISPLKYNAMADKSDVDWITNDENFLSDVYLDRYDESLLERASVWIGNVFFGSSIDQVVIYREALFDYFKSIDENVTKKHQDEAYKQLVKEYAVGITKVIEAALIEEVETNGPEKAVELFSDFVSDMESFVDLAPDDLSDALKENIINALLKYDIHGVEYFSGEMKALETNISKTLEVTTEATRDANMKLCDGWYKELQEFARKHDIQLDKLNKKVSKLTNIMNCASFVISVGSESVSAYFNYCDAVASIKTVEDNMYILDCIISTADNGYLVEAARQIKNATAPTYGTQKSQLITLYAMDVGAAITTELIHEIIGDLGVPGAIIEAARFLGNTFFEIDDKSESAAIVVAFSLSAKVLSENYKAHLEGGYAFQYKTYWVAYSDYSEEFLRSILNLALLRNMAEDQMRVWIEDESVKNYTQQTKQRCSTLYDKYTLKYQLYLQKR